MLKGNIIIICVYNRGALPSILDTKNVIDLWAYKEAEIY